MQTTAKKPRRYNPFPGVGRKNGIGTIIDEIRAKKRNCSVCSMTFAPLPNAEARKVMEAYMQEHFDLWWDSWVAPLLDEIEKKIK